jgi:trimethylamine--corrinoid protein Co-methyltransferase
MTAAGSTAPSTEAGALVISNADVLSGLVMHQLVRPGAPFIYGTMPGMLDMSATVWAYGSPDFFLLTAAATELCHHYNLPMFGTAGCGDAKEVDLQCATEVALSCLLAAQTGANLVHNVGLLDSSMMVSPAQIVLADEILGMVAHMVRGVEVSPQELQLGLIDKVGPRGEFLTADHTFSNFKRFWYPQVFERRRYDVVQKAGRQSLLDRLNARTIEISERVQVEPLPNEVARELEAREQTWRADASIPTGRD